MSKWDLRLKLGYRQIGPDVLWSHNECGVVLRARTEVWRRIMRLRPIGTVQISLLSGCLVKFSYFSEGTIGSVGWDARA